MLGTRLAQGHRETAAEETLQTIVDVVGVSDADDGVVAILRRACELLGAERASLLRVLDGEVIEEAVYDRREGVRVRGWRDRLDRQEPLLEALSKGTAVVEAGRADGGVPGGSWSRPGSQSVILALGEQGSGSGFMVATRPVGPPPRDKAQNAVRALGDAALHALAGSRRYARARAASETMAGFLHLVVHDLRAPLTVLSGYFDLLRDGTFGAAPAAWDRPMELITSKLAETHRLIDDLLLAARLEAGELPSADMQIDLNDVIHRAAERAEPRAQLAGGHVEALPATAPVLVRADRFHVDRIVDNLVNNAIVYGGHSPAVRLSVDSSQPSPALRVQDSGIGISSDLHERIFDRFFRVNHDVPGTGFGLHVARSLAESCGGSLGIERSAPSEGSTFRLELPGAAAG